MPDLTICRHSADFWTSKTTLKTEWRLTTFDLSKSSTFLCTEASWKFKKNCLFWAKFKKKMLWRQIWRLFIFPWRYFEKYIWHHCYQWRKWCHWLALICLVPFWPEPLPRWVYALQYVGIKYYKEGKWEEQRWAPALRPKSESLNARSLERVNPVWLDFDQEKWRIPMDA